MEISNGIYLYDVNIDLNETIEGLEYMCEMENPVIEWIRMFPFMSKHKNIGFMNVEDESKIDKESGWDLFLHDLSKTSNEIFIESAIDYFNKNNIIKKPFYNFYFTKFENGAKEIPMKDNHKNENNRTISFKYFINDNYDGGETEFLDLGIKIKPKSGQLLVHPATQAYVEREVKNGNKYQLITWA